MKKPFFNNTKKPVYKGATLIPPGQSRDVDEMFLDKAKHAEEKTAELSLVEEIQALSIGKAKERFDDLETPELNDLKSLEESQEEPRKGLLAAITEELLVRESADEDADGDSNPDADGDGTDKDPE